VFSGEDTSVLDPCAGTGAVLTWITSGAKAVRCAVELDAYRAVEAGKIVDQTILGNCFDVQCAVESLSLLFLNPPYNHEVWAPEIQDLKRSEGYPGCSGVPIL
jgi:16S rRNA G966 N2-methylase RsmD